MEAASWRLEAQGLQVVWAQLGSPPGAGGQHLGGQLCRRLLHLGQGGRGHKHARLATSGMLFMSGVSSAVGFITFVEYF